MNISGTMIVFILSIMPRLLLWAFGMAKKIFRLELSIQYGAVGTLIAQEPRLVLSLEQGQVRQHYPTSGLEFLMTI